MKAIPNLASAVNRNNRQQALNYQKRQPYDQTVHKQIAGSEYNSVTQVADNVVAFSEDKIA